MESSRSFADLLEALEDQSSALGLTHYAVSMPTLEEVFLACTAEAPPAEEAASQAGRGADTQGEASGAASPGQLLSPDGSCVIQMSDLRGGAMQSGTGAEKQAASGGSLSQGQQSSLPYSSSIAEAPERHEAAAAERGQAPDSEGSSAAAAAEPNAEVSSDVGATADDQQHIGTQQPAPSISRDDSAQMLWHASEEASHSHEHAKSYLEAEQPSGHDASESGPSSSSSHQGASSANQKLRTGEREGKHFSHVDQRTACHAMPIGGNLTSVACRARRTGEYGWVIAYW